MISPEEKRAAKNLFLAKRKRMIGMRSDGHWLNLHPEVRDAFSEAFPRLSYDELADTSGFPRESVEKWMTQAQIVKDLRERLDACRVKGRLRCSLAASLRPDACGLARLAGPLPAARALQVPRSSLKRWLSENWDKKIVSHQVEAAPAPAPATPEACDDSDGIKADAEAKQLSLFLERHKGKVHKKYSLSEKRLMMALCDRFGSKAVHDTFGVSYDTIARLKRHQDTELERKARTPLRYIPVVDLMKKHPGMGPMQIRDYIHRHLGLSMGVASIRKIMEQQGWVPPFVKTTRVKDGTQLYEAARKNYLWHMDFKHQYVNKCKCYILFIQDDYSRFIAGHAIADGEKVEVVMTAVEEAIRIHGKPESIMSDGGSAFFAWRGSSRFTRFLEDYGIEQMIAQTPNVNGKLENLNQQVEKEVLMVNNFASVDHFKQELAKWVGHYNFSRPHQGLGDRQVPADRYFPGANTWFGKNSEITRQQSLIAETMATLLSELKKS